MMELTSSGEGNCWCRCGLSKAESSQINDSIADAESGKKTHKFYYTGDRKKGKVLFYGKAAEEKISDHVPYDQWQNLR